LNIKEKFINKFINNLKRSKINSALRKRRLILNEQFKTILERIKFEI